MHRRFTCFPPPRRLEKTDGAVLPPAGPGGGGGGAQPLRVQQRFPLFVLFFWPTVSRGGNV